MGEGLREVPHQPSRHRVVLLGQQAQVVAEPHQAVEKLTGIVVAPEHWGSGVAKVLLDAARQLSPSGLDLDVNTDNARAIRFYEKCGFSRSGAGVNPISGKPVHRMSWRPPMEGRSGEIS